MHDSSHHWSQFSLLVICGFLLRALIWHHALSSAQIYLPLCYLRTSLCQKDAIAGMARSQQQALHACGHRTHTAVMRSSDEASTRAAAD